MITNTAPHPRRGGASLAAVFWLFALLLMAAPFLRHPQAAHSDDLDRGRSDEDIPFSEDLAGALEDLELDLEPVLEEARRKYFASDSTYLRASGLIDVHRLEAGEKNYDQHCLGCHGVIGDGAGPAARFLNPRPRNFRKGLFKFTSTESGRRPLRKDLFATITNGLAGASMPEFRLLPEEKRHDIVEYVRYLSIRGEFEQLMLDSTWDEEEIADPEEIMEIVAGRWSPERNIPVYPGAPEPPKTPESVALGKEIFIDAARGNCATCHGEGGRGDGPTADAYHDDWGYPIRPRDFTLGVFRAGQEGADLYRTITTGIQGTPMGAFGGTLEPEEIWHLVHYVQSLGQ